MFDQVAAKPSKIATKQHAESSGTRSSFAQSSYARVRRVHQVCRILQQSSEETVLRSARDSHKDLSQQPAFSGTHDNVPWIAVKRRRGTPTVLYGGQQINCATWTKHLRWFPRHSHRTVHTANTYDISCPNRSQTPPTILQRSLERGSSNCAHNTSLPRRPIHAVDAKAKIIEASLQRSRATLSRFAATATMCVQFAHSARVNSHLHSSQGSHRRKNLRHNDAWTREDMRASGTLDGACHICNGRSHS